MPHIVTVRDIGNQISVTVEYPFLPVNLPVLVVSFRSSCMTVLYHYTVQLALLVIGILFQQTSIIIVLVSFSFRPTFYIGQLLEQTVVLIFLVCSVKDTVLVEVGYEI